MPVPTLPIVRTSLRVTFSYFQGSKKDLKGTKFQMNTDMVEAVEVRYKALSKNDLHFVFKKWVKRWHQCIATSGSYFEKEHVPVHSE